MSTSKLFCAGLVSAGPIEPALGDQVQAFLSRFGSQVSSWPTCGVDWQGRFFSVHTDAYPPLMELSRLKAFVTAKGVDIAFPSADLVQDGPRLVVTDVDSTLIREEVIEELAAKAGVREKVAAITERAMSGQLDFAQSLKERVAALSGLPQSVIAQVSADLSLSFGARELVAKVHSLGGSFAVVSGGFAEVIGPIVEDLAVDFWAANRLGISDGKLSGKTVGEVITGDCKAKYFRQWSGGDFSRCIAVGDGANDLGMLSLASLGVAYCAKPTVRQAAGASLSFPRLDAILGFIGHSS